MSQEPWQTLGIEPTADSLDIKRAYAKALKRCRPDDDPEGYQRLRESLEWALEEARLSALEGFNESAAQDPGSGRQEGQNTPGDRESHPAQGAQSEGGEKDWAEPGELAQSLHSYWREKGDQALLDAWPSLHYELERMPLGLRADSSNWFASLVLESPELPPEFLERLAAYFQWGEDFRSDAMLGEQRSFEINERMREAGVYRKLDSRVRDRFAELLHLDRLIDAGADLRAVVFAALASPKNDERLADLTPQLLRGLGIEAAGVSDLRHKLTLGLMIRLMPLSLLFGFLVFATKNQDWMLAVGLAFLSAAVAPIASGAAELLRSGVDRLYLKLPMLKRAERPGNWRCASSVLAAALAGAMPMWVEPASSLQVALTAGLLALALMLAWSTTFVWRGMLLPTWFALFIALASLPDSSLSHPLSTAPSIALVWTLLAHMAFLYRPAEVFNLYRAPLEAFLPQTPVGWIIAVWGFIGVVILVAAILVLMLPLTYLVLTLARGTRFAIITLAFAFSAGFLYPGSGLPWFLCLMLAPIVTIGLQKLGSRMSKKRWLSALPARG